ncbi:MAG: NADH-ubiquinone oxidoreductase-F iron-sulfur binding region domain-containing protein [Acidimicrobiales bacterium]
MVLVERVLPAEPVEDLAAYVERYEGGRALEVAKKVPAATMIEELEAAGLRGRGGAGFPTGRKWRTVAENRSEVLPATVVVNAAEGEPGTFKDRAILRANPYHVLEGALVAARVVGADTVVFALKATFTTELERVRRAVSEITEAGWLDGIQVDVVEGPGEYLYGEETAMLEVIAGRAPLPRIAPPYRRGVDEVVDTVADAESESGLAAPVELAGGAQGNVAPPTLVDNVETLANVPLLALRGSEWFRRVGTLESPGTIVCTITGRVRHPGTAEVAMGTTLRAAIEEVGGGVEPDRTIAALVPGVSNAFIPPDLLDTPMTYEAMEAIGSGLGSAGFIVLDDTDDLVAAAAGVSRFLAVESCGQCTPCKQDGLAMAELLAGLAASTADEHDLEDLVSRTATVGDGARCNLALQQQAVVSGLLRRWSAPVAHHIAGRAEGHEPLLVAEIVDIDEGGVAVDTTHADKQPDWTFDDEDSGMTPVERFTDHRDEPES